MDIGSIDKNLAVAETVCEDGIVYHNVRNAPFRVYGLMRSQDDSRFCRLPEEAARAVSQSVSSLAFHTAGGRVRFATDSPVVVLRAVMNSGITRFPHMPLTGTTGFDLFENLPNGTARYCNTFVPPVNLQSGYTSRITTGPKKLRYFTVDFPPYNNVNEVYIGVEEGSQLAEGLPYRNDLPVVYYGSSITQGGCASRPGNTYTGILSHRLNLDYINLGFSGSGKGEPAMAEYLASLPMCAFVCDYDYNAPDAPHLMATHLPLYRAIRRTHPTMPYLMISKANTHGLSREADLRRRDIIANTYRTAREEGDQNVYFLDGDSIYREPYIDFCTVDGCHPGDLGMMLMADAIQVFLSRWLTN